MSKEQKTDNLILISMALGAIIFHILLNGQYGFHRDELDFIMNARQLAWGYVSYPPITPLFARIGLELFGGSLRGLRVLPAIAQGIVMILAALMARDMGGNRNAQILTAFAVFIAPFDCLAVRSSCISRSIISGGCWLRSSPSACLPPTTRFIGSASVRGSVSA